MKVFISYSRHDEEFVDRLNRELSTLGYDIWVDTEDIVAGGQDRWRRSIVAAIRQAEVTVLVLSPNSIHSENVERELSVAAENGKRVIPVLYQPCELPDGFQYELAGVHYIDFSRIEFNQGVRQLAMHIGPPHGVGSPVAAFVAPLPPPAPAPAVVKPVRRGPSGLVVAGVAVAVLLIGGIIVAAKGGGDDPTVSSEGQTVPPSSVEPVTPQLPPQTTITAVEVTAAPAPLADPTRAFCIRADIDFAALRESPDISSTLLVQIPAGDCSSTLIDIAPSNAGNIDWYHVLSNGVEGWTATTNALARCVRANIDFSSLRSDPDLASTKIDEIPPGSCDVLLVEPTPLTAGGITWLHVLWNGAQGWTAESNMA